MYMVLYLLCHSKSNQRNELSSSTGLQNSGEPQSFMNGEIIYQQDTVSSSTGLQVSGEPQSYMTEEIINQQDTVSCWIAN